MSVLRPAARQLRREGKLLRCRYQLTAARNYATPSASTTPAAASSYLSELLELPSSAAFPPQLALQLLTHKSYRFVNRLTNMSEEELVQSQVSHNARFSFLGRRALASYLAMFLHSQVRTTEGARQTDFLNGKDIETRLADMLHENNVGRWVGDRWGVQNVMRWTANQVSLAIRKVELAVAVKVSCTL